MYIIFYNTFLQLPHLYFVGFSDLVYIIIKMSVIDRVTLEDKEGRR